RAGVYNLAEPPLGPGAAPGEINPLPFRQFRIQLTEVMAIGNPFPTKGRDHYVASRSALEAKIRAGRAPVQQQINLSAYLLRLRQYEEALRILTPLGIQERGNFLVNANLMTAYQLNGHLDRAFHLLPLVKGGRPPAWQGATKEQLDWYARAESYHQKLIDRRYRESLRHRSPQPPQTVDDLFDGVSFVAESGRFEAGKLAAAERAKLPRDAVALVQQLILWLPDDTRLYWLLGELLNAEGDLANAFAVFDECRREGRRLDAADLRDHRQILKEVLEQAPPAAKVQEEIASLPSPDSPPAPTE